jgi:Beta-glucanase/Beta-glucan synthetase
MKTFPHTIVFCLLLVLMLFNPNHPSAKHPDTKTSEWKLVWQDEFSGPKGSRVDKTKWSAQVGGSGWGNRELEYYTDRTINAFQSEGMLNITALKEHFTGMDGVTREYTSARLTTKNTFTSTYGRFEARIKLPRGQGIWPAFWMLGADISTTGWPRCGEIDIMENVGKEPTIIHGTIHGPGYSGTHGITSSYSLKRNEIFADSFHTFAVQWEPDVIRFYCDKVNYKTVTRADLPEGTKWVFDQPFYLLLNVAVGGNWPGSPDATSSFPQVMLVDFVRVYQKA